MPGSRVTSALAVTAIAFGSILAGCGGESGEESAAGAGPDFGGLPINLANCEDWNAASAEDRLATVTQIREFTGGPVGGTGGTGAVLEDDRAYDYFDNYCENEFARGFKLYKLYSRAAAFDGQ